MKLLFFIILTVSAFDVSYPRPESIPLESSQCFSRCEYSNHTCDTNLECAPSRCCSENGWCVSCDKLSGYNSMVRCTNDQIKEYNKECSPNAAPYVIFTVIILFIVVLVFLLVIGLWYLCYFRRRMGYHPIDV